MPLNILYVTENKIKYFVSVKRYRVSRFQGKDQNQCSVSFEAIN